MGHVIVTVWTNLMSKELDGRYSEFLMFYEKPGMTDMDTVQSGKLKELL